MKSQSLSRLIFPGMITAMIFLMSFTFKPVDERFTSGDYYHGIFHEVQKLFSMESNKVTADKNVEEFLEQSADARMMDAAEGKLAVEKGTTDAIKNYGKLMVTDQAKLLKEIQQLAASHHIILPEQISDKKEKHRKILAAKAGEDFDHKFIKMITIDHKRDVRMFTKATEFEDAELSSFAKKYLPMIQGHLDKINAIKDGMK